MSLESYNVEPAQGAGGGRNAGHERHGASARRKCRAGRAPLHAAAPRGRGIGDGLRARQLPAAAIVRAIWAASAVSSGWPQIDSTES